MKQSNRYGVVFCLMMLLSQNVTADGGTSARSAAGSSFANRLRCSHGNLAPWVAGWSCNFLESRRSPYVSFIIGGAFSEIESGGFNTLGAFNNTGDDTTGTLHLGGAIGIAIPRTTGRLRLECEGLSHETFKSVTNSFQPPTPTFFYDFEVNNRWTAMGNLWKDSPINEHLDIYIGGGIGAAGGMITVNDGVVAGQSRFSQLAWQFGIGLNLHPSDRVEIDLGYRYIDFGTAETGLLGPSGNYTADLTAHQLQVGIRFRSLGSLLSRR